MSKSFTSTVATDEPWDDFFRHPAISFSRNERLKELFETVLDPDQKVTLFLGAGVSLDAGLPSWNRLISNMANSISERWRPLVDADPSDPMRKAEYLVQMVREGTNQTEGQIVRDALYPESKASPRVGILADAVARLAAVMGDRLRIVTTNFDLLVEDWLKEYVPEGQIHSYSLSEWQMRKAVNDAISGDPDDPAPPPPNGAVGAGGGTTTAVATAQGSPEFHILHVHGILEPNKDERGPIVLTESSFLQNGPDVRQEIKNSLIDSCVVFMGVSLTDPNLIGPLWELKKSGMDYVRPFTIQVAAPDQAAKDKGDSRAFAIKRALYLAEELNLGAVFLKSYAQIPQALHELSLAASVEGYLDNADTSIRYGNRLQTALASCYQAVGCSAGEDIPTADGAKELSERLHAALYGPDGLVEELKAHATLVSTSNNPRERAIYQKHKEDFENERFGLFLWLRSQADGGQDAEYRLNLVGTSVYTHREAWSLDRHSNISQFSRHAVSRAAFTGLLQVENINDSRAWQLWRGMVAVPFTIHGRTNPASFGEHLLDVISVGGITLNSTNEVTWVDGSENPRSILSTFRPVQIPLLTDRLADIARAIVTPDPLPDEETTEAPIE